MSNFSLKIRPFLAGNFAITYEEQNEDNRQDIEMVCINSKAYFLAAANFIPLYPIVNEINCKYSVTRHQWTNLRVSLHIRRFFYSTTIVSIGYREGDRMQKVGL